MTPLDVGPYILRGAIMQAVPKSLSGAGEATYTKYERAWGLVAFRRCPLSRTIVTREWNREVARLLNLGYPERRR
jgi:hypothetical protein